MSDAQAGRLISEEEREYGKIPKKIYLEYLWACSACVGTSYLLSAIAWQGLRVYTDYWLNQWTESENKTATLEQRKPHTENSNVCCLYF